MLEKCDALQIELNEAKTLREETQRKYDDVAQRTEQIQKELEESKKSVASDKEAFEVYRFLYNVLILVKFFFSERKGTRECRTT